MSLMLLGCKESDEQKKKEQNMQHSYAEQFRPQYHFSPTEKWMNDPNGLVYNEGIYHLFYQYYPDDIVWGPMHWGHATSTDMVHWTHKPIALFPDENGLIFSGSAVVDKNNTSGFAKIGETPLVAIFTYHSMEGEKAGRTDFQTQGIAYSLDNGDTWEKYEGNPVIGNSGIKDFRDPKVFWHNPSQSWILTLVAGDHAKLYASKNLKEWTHLSDFGKDQGAHGGVWECPDLFPLQVEGSTEQKWVLLISINPGAPNGGSGTQYFVGDFDGTHFISDQQEPQWLDYGTDNYAGVTYNNTPNGDRIFIGWMSNWDYARETPTEKWRSAMTLPRQLKLIKQGDGYVVSNSPLDQVNALATNVALENFEVAPEKTQTFTLDGLQQSRIKLSTMAKDFRMIFSNEAGDELILEMDAKLQTLIVDRSNSGMVDFQKEFGNKKNVAPIAVLGDSPLDMEIYLDQSSVEVFLNGGLVAMTDQIFPTEPYTILQLENRNANEKVAVVAIEHMASIW